MPPASSEASPPGAVAEGSPDFDVTAVVDALVAEANAPAEADRGGGADGANGFGFV